MHRTHILTAVYALLLLLLPRPRPRARLSPSSARLVYISNCCEIRRGRRVFTFIYSLCLSWPTSRYRRFLTLTPYLF